VINVLPSLVRKTMRDWNRAVIGWAVGLTAFTSIYVGFWAGMRNNPELLKLKTQSLPKALSAAFGVTDLTTGVGYLQGSVYGLLGPLLLSMAAIVLGARAIAGPEDDHVMDLYLANPVSRRGFVAQRCAALLGALVGFGLILWIIPLVLSQALDMGVSGVNVSAASTGLFLLGVFFGMLALAVGAMTGRRSTALTVAGAVAVAGYVIRGLSESVSWLLPWRWISPFHYYLGSDPLHRGFNLAYLAVLAVAAAVFVTLAVTAFDRRDIRV
jgi:ABC-2 type transport system permease protein